MKTRYVWAIAGMVLLALSLVGCQETQKANALVDVGNKSVEEANKLSAEARKKTDDLFGAESMKDFPENRAELKSKVDDVNGLLDKSITSLKSAAEKFEEASKLKIDDKLKEYYTTKAQSYRKLADINETAKKQTSLLTDASISERDGLVSKLEPLDEQIKKMQKELDDLEAKAKKIQTDNPKLFQKS